MAYEVDIMKELMWRVQCEMNQSLYELSKMPEGRLYPFRQGDKTYYYQIFGKGKDRTRKGISANSKLVYQLARKEYLIRATKGQAAAMRWIKQTVAKIDLDFWQSVMIEVQNRFPQLPPHVFILGERYEDTGNRKGTMFLDETIHRTKLGVMVRSKSELIIAEMLESQEIPYQYEVELPFDDYHLCPDFTVVRPRDGKIIFWEHFGLTNDSEYIKRMDLKLVKYRNMNIKPWDNLMISYDREDGSLDMGIIRALIESWLK